MKIYKIDWFGFWVVMAVSTLMLFTLYAEARACDSFEECIGSTAEQTKGSKTAEAIIAVESAKQALALRAIAYKLDEISKKLDKPTVSEIPNHLLTPAAAHASEDKK